MHKHIATLTVGILIGLAASQLTAVHADQEPALTRQLVEHLVRANEQQADALKDIAREVNKCR
jgi:uncharacterized membrane-anchored protein YhcB (DUF1043 family)